jgi:hypothetical protein
MKKKPVINADLSSVVAELKKRSTKQFVLSDFLFEQQLKFVEDPARFKTAVTTRRSGKTVSCAADLINTAIETPEIVAVYITLTRGVAKRNIWPELKRINRTYKLGAEFNESDLSINFLNGSIIYLSGAADKADIEKFRGLSIKKVYLDECQSFPIYIQELIDEVLAPALMDHAGALILIGTPGPIPAGYFYDCANSTGWSHHFWSFFDNNHFPALRKGYTHQRILQEELDRTGLTLEHPKIQREWFGRWVLDKNSLVYQYSAAKNDYDTLPAHDYVFIMGIDVGYHDADAIAVLAYSEETRKTYLVEELLRPKQNISDLIDQIKQLRDKYAIDKMVIDTGGLGKKIAEELISRHGIAVEAADKTRKVEYIELMNDDLRTGRFMAKKGSQFAQDAMKVEWDFEKSTPEKRKISDRFHSDMCDAVLYCWRVSYSYMHTPKVVAPKWGTPAWANAEEERLEEEAMEFFTKMEENDKDPYES